MSAETTLTPDVSRAIDRTLRPDVPAAVADLWDGWGYAGLAGFSEAADAAQLRTALQGITSVVNAMAGGDLYRVGLLGQGTAYTDLKSRLVNVTAAALRDQRLTLDEALAVTTAMAIHEAGHGRLSRPMERAVKSAWKGDEATAARAHRLSNIVDDVRLEADTAAQWPAYAETFGMALWWVAQRYPSGGITRMPASKGEALNMAIAAIRYDHLTTWATDADVQAERAWWKRWGADAAAQQRPMDHVAALRVALDHIDALPDAVEAPEAPAPSVPFPGMPDEGEQGDEGDDEAGTPGQTDDEADEAEGQGGESDPDEGDDEPVDLPGLPGEADDAEAEADEQDGDDADGAGTPDDSVATHGHEADTEQDDLPDEAEWDDDGATAEAEYRHTDETVEQGTDQDDDSEASDVQVYGRTEAEDYRQTEAEQQGTSQKAERDALTDALPAHATEAVTADDRDRDIMLGQSLVQTSLREARDRIEVTHIGGYDADDQGSITKVVAGITPLITDRTSIPTNPAVQGALRAAFTSRRTARDNRDVARSGRISGSRAYRVRAGFDNVFTRRDAVSPDRLDVHLLVDASGSMSGRSGGYYDRGPRRIEQASQMAANITEALAALPFVRVHVWAHNTANGTAIYDVFDSRRGDKVGRMAGIKSAAANNDATAIAALTQRITSERTTRERSVMVVISDGAPCEPEPWVRGAVENARKQSVGVMSVAISGGLTKTQEACYGTDWVVPFTDWDSLARNIARMVGRLA